MEAGMAQYTVRVELHRADSDDYESLHEYMGDEGFRRYITNSNDCVKYQLPTAEYNITSRQRSKRDPQESQRGGISYPQEVYGSCNRIRWPNMVQLACLGKLITLLLVCQLNIQLRALHTAIIKTQFL